MKIHFITLLLGFSTAQALAEQVAYIGQCGVLGIDSQPTFTHLKADTVEVYHYSELVSAIEQGVGNITIPDGVTIGVPNQRGAITLKPYQSLTSTRGRSNEPGKLVIEPNLTNDSDTYPVIVVSSGVTISGLVIEGPVKVSDSSKKTIGIQTKSAAQGVTIENNELFGWPWAAVSFKSSKNNVVKNNYIHSNIKSERGYGVVVQNGHATARIECNVFDRNRHAIAGAGLPGEGYVARYNLVMQGGGRGAYHQFDMHGDSMGNAGSFVKVYSNWFDFGDYGTSNRSAIMVRGVPIEGWLEVSNNVFKSPFKVTSRNNAITGVSGALPAIEEIMRQNQFEQAFVYRKNLSGQCEMQVAHETIPLICSAIGY
ncbi:right-handed parallel beta-helix repeat-containing protein [Vibrio scophthalmi]|uniref:Right handed beta helix domain-containing protein n=1 Tax=Vibrio scophthalmi LMG 19158 TaxID=870967 RepID=F9RMG6_9VIBR|nr:right-handed parallel beta-helix repeat-containing protein [Vibrio scophthalmi]EGU38282.1 hypothetical protein VIS19158_00105 [Vibrio scophthalmi LMG 19158]